MQLNLNAENQMALIQNAPTGAAETKNVDLEVGGKKKNFRV